MKKQVIDQSAHFFAAIAILFSAYLLGTTFTIFSGGILGFSFGVIREITENDPITSKGSMLDILFWTLGGLTAGFVF